MENRAAQFVNVKILKALPWTLTLMMKVLNKFASQHSSHGGFPEVEGTVVIGSRLTSFQQILKSGRGPLKDDEVAAHRSSLSGQGTVCCEYWLTVNSGGWG